MKKKIIFIIGILVIGGFVSNVDAKECVYGLQSISIPYNGSWASTKVRKFKTSANVCLADNMSVLFTTGSYIDGSSFKIEAQLMESDPAEYKPDEIAKTYLGTNTGLDVMDWNRTYRNTANLDSVGDQTCELYMRFRVTKPLAQNGSFEPDMFRYTICVE